MAKKPKKYRVFISPEGKRVRVYNLKKFAKDIGISYDSARSLSIGRLTSIKGWYSPASKSFKHLYYEREMNELINVHTKERCRIGRNLIQLAKKLNMSDNYIKQLLMGNYTMAKGWVTKATYDAAYN